MRAKPHNIINIAIYFHTVRLQHRQNFSGKKVKTYSNDKVLKNEVQWKRNKLNTVLLLLNNL